MIPLAVLALVAVALFPARAFVVVTWAACFLLGSALLREVVAQVVV